MRHFFYSLLVLACAAATPALAQDKYGAGWHVHPSKLAFGPLVEKLEQTITAEKMGVVFKASASANVKARLNETIPGNAVIGIFRPDFAKRMLAASLAAGLEAPLHMMVAENADGTATVMYRAPSAVFAPYMTEGGAALKTVAGELDAVFAKIAAEAVK